MKKIICYIVIVSSILSGGSALAQIDTNAREIPWQYIDNSDILWSKRVWREIAIYEKANTVLRNVPGAPKENIFANVLLSGIRQGFFQAYSDDLLKGDPKLYVDAPAQDDVPVKGKKKKIVMDEWIDLGIPEEKNDTTKLLPPQIMLQNPLTMEELNKRISCDPPGLSVNAKKLVNFCERHKGDSIDFFAGTTLNERKGNKSENTSPAYDTTTPAICMYPQQVSHYGIIEEWLFDRKAGQMVVHILAIAPIANGKALFWVRYPDIRRYIARYEVYKDKASPRCTWDEYFESRQFASRITHVE